MEVLKGKKEKKAKDKINKSENVQNGRPYWFQVMVDGKRVTKRGFRTKGEAQKARAAMETQLFQGDYIEPNKLTYSKYFTQWLGNRANIADSTRELYQSYFDTHIDEALGDLSLSKLTPLIIQTFVRELREKDLADETVKRIYSVVNTSLNSALKMDIISKNVANKIEKPTVKRVEREIWNNESMRTFLMTTKGETRYWIAIFLALMTGMRQGEILGLRWSDIDFNKKIIQVRRGLKKDKTGFTELKTDKSRRTIGISTMTIKVLEEQRDKLELEKNYLGSEYEDGNLVVCSNRGTPARASKVLHAWNRLCEQYKPADEPTMTFHDLRHQSASLMLNDGINIRVVSERLGHSNVSTTMNIYSHLLPNAQEEAADSLEKSLGFSFGIEEKNLSDE